MSQDSNNRFVLTVAGSDTSCGAGLQSDIITLREFGVRPLCAATAITCQTEARVFDVTPVPADLLGKQLSSAAACGKISAVKVGMLGSLTNVRALVFFLQGLKCPNVVVDPVLASSSGMDLLEVSAHSAFKDALLPMASVITPNTVEAGLLAGMTVWNVDTMKDAARRMWDDCMARRETNHVPQSSPLYVLIKGGHLAGSSTDLLFDGDGFKEFCSERITNDGGASTVKHGTGCRLSAAIAAGLAKGDSVVAAIEAAKKFVTKYIAS